MHLMDTEQLYSAILPMRLSSAWLLTEYLFAAFRGLLIANIVIVAEL